MVLVKKCDPLKGPSLKYLSQLSFMSHWNKQSEVYFTFVDFVHG